MSFSEYLPYYKRNLKVAFPVMLTQLGIALMGVIDSIMVGHHSTAELAAVSFANAIFFSVMLFPLGIMMGLTPMVGKAYTQGERVRVRRLFANGLLNSTLWGITTVLFMACFIPLIPHMGQESVVVEKAQPYYILVVLSILPLIIGNSFRQFLEGLGNTMVAMIITISSNLLNIILNGLLIFGLCGLPELGSTGAAIATLVSRCTLPIAFVLAMKFKREWAQYLKKSDKSDISRTVIREINKIGMPIGFQTWLETIAFTLSFIFVGWISKETLAAHQIANHMSDLTFMIALGVGAATTIRISHQWGANNYEGIRMAANASIHLIIVLNSIGALLMVSFRHLIPHIFTTDIEVIEIAANILIYTALYQLSDGLQAVGAAMLRGIQDVKAPMYIALLAYGVICLPLGYVLTFPCEMGVDGMWIGFIVGLSVAAILFHIRFRKKFKELIPPHLPQSPDCQ